MAETPRSSTVRYGQQLMGKSMQVVTFTEQEMEARRAKGLLGQAKTTITPLGRDDNGQSRVQVFTNPDLSDYFQSYDDKANIIVPSVLNSLSIVYNKGGGGANYTENATCSATSPFSVGMSVSGTCQATASCIPQIQQDIQNLSRENVPVTRCWFYTASMADALVKLTAELGSPVLAWPNFKARAITINLKGQKTNATGRASYQANASVGTSGGSEMISTGFGEGYDTSFDIGQIQIPPTLHGAFSLTASDSEGFSATAFVVAVGDPLSGGSSGVATATAQASIAPSSFSATSPTTLPTSGLYLYQLDIELNDVLDNNLAHAIVLDFSKL